MSSFVHLHVHTEFSLLDGAARIDALIEKAKTHNMPAIAITDHGSMFGAIYFYQKAKKAGIKPIIGCEVYMATRTRFDKDANIDNSQYHFVLLARNNTGYRNLMKIVSLGHTEGFYYKPRVDREVLENYSEGVTALSGCIAGEIPTLILQEDIEKATETAKYYQGVFGKDNFYLEIQDQGLSEQKIVNEALIKISKDTGIPLVATNDVHYLNKEDATVHDVLLCIQTVKTINEEKRMRFNSDEYYFKTFEEMESVFSDCPEALSNTVKIADACEIDLDFDNTYLPNYELPEGVEDFEYLRKLCFEGLSERYEDINEELKERLEYELRIINQMGFSSYFLIVWDFVRYAREREMLVGPGRGSAAGSLVAYTLGITNIDPIKYGLLFERFLNPERVSMPDIDIDFCDDRREEVIDYVVEKYGADNVAQIITFGTMAARSAVRDVGRVLDIPYNEVDRIAKLIPFEVGITIDKALEQNKDLKAAYKEDSHKNLIDISRAVEGLPRHASTHAAGVVISKEPLTTYVPLQKGTDNKIVTQYTMDKLEELGLLKVDFLGLKTLGVIEKTLANVFKTKNKKLDIEKIPLDDKNTFDLLSSGETGGVFQLESSGMKNVLRELKPNKIEDIIAVVALYRPGPMEQIPTFINSKYGKIPIEYLHPALEKILKETYGVIVYQEQIMQIAAEIAGFNLGEADILRRAIGKKKKGLIDEQREKFVTGCIETGYGERLGKDIYDLIEKFASYGFNKSHAAAYAMIAYQTAYLKANYPVEFMAALLTRSMSDTDKIALYIADYRRRGGKVLPPDINESAEDFTVVGDNEIRFGLSAIKNVGLGAIQNIIAERANGYFESLTDFCSRVDLRTSNKKVIESLIKAGAFDTINKNRAAFLSFMDEAINAGQIDKRDREKGQISMLSLFSEEEVSAQKQDRLYDIPPFSAEEKLRIEKEVLGVYITGHPLDEYRSVLDNLPNLMRCAELNEIKKEQSISIGGIFVNLKEIYTKKGKLMAFATLEDLTGSTEVIIFNKLYEKTKDLFNEEKPLLIKGRTDLKIEDESQKEVKIIAEEIMPLPMESRQLFINVALQDEEVTKLFDLRNLLFKKDGEMPVYLHFIGTNKTMLFSDDFRALNDENFLKKIETLLGVGSVIVHEIKTGEESKAG